MDFFNSLIGPAAVIQINLKKNELVKHRIRYAGGGKEELYVFKGSEAIEGEVTISPRRSNIDHIGVKIELIGQIETFFEASTVAPPFQFFALVKELDTPGVLDRVRTYPFRFDECEKQYDSYNGVRVRLRYILKVTVTRQIASVIDKEMDVWILTKNNLVIKNTPIQSEVGIQECIHLEVEWSKEMFHLKEIIFGKIHFVLVKVKIKYMEITLSKKEQLGIAENSTKEAKTILKSEVMDGCPSKDETIPVRLFLSNYATELTPTYKNVNNQFSVRYYLNTVLIDEADRRYFNSQEIILYRREKP